MCKVLDYSEELSSPSIYIFCPLQAPGLLGEITNTFISLTMHFDYLAEEGLEKHFTSWVQLARVH